MNKVKILRIVTRLNIGGPAIQAIDLCSKLNSSGFESLLIKGKENKREGTLENVAKERGIEIITVSELTRELNLIKDVKAFIKIFLLIKKHKPDIVHTHMAKAGFLGRLAAFFNRVPLIVHTYHGHVLSGYFSAIKTRLFLLLEKAMAWVTDIVIVISPSQKMEITEKYRICKPGKCRIIKLGFDLDRFLSAETNLGKLRNELLFTKDDILIGIAGRMAPIMAGDGPLKSEIKDKIKKNSIENNVFLLGWRRSMELFYADLDIMCLTSINEGTPVSLIEAMAAAKPIVATDVGGVKDIVFDGKNGFLVPPGNVDMFSQRLADLIENSNMRKRFGSYGRDFVKENYTLDKLLNSISDMYTKELERVKK